jgi:hypothetical protein
MNPVQKTLSASLLAGGALLVGSADESRSQPRLDASGLAETLGLPLNGAKRQFWNAATQTTGQIACAVSSADVIECKVRASSAMAQMDYDQTQKYRIGADGSLAITTKLDKSVPWQGDYRTTTNYANFYTSAAPAAWTAQSPLARTSPDGKVVQNNVKMVQAIDGGGVSITSNAPLGATFGLQISNTFDKASGAVQATILPLVAYSGGTLSITAPQISQRALTADDQTVLNTNSAIAAAGGGTGYKASIVQPPNF